jgi:mycothiol synthase
MNALREFSKGASDGNTHAPLVGAADVQRVLDLKRACTTPENLYDAPTLSELRALLAPLAQDPAAERPPWEDEQGRVIGHLYRRAMTQQATMIWEEADGTLVAYALIAPPSTALTFQVHPQARGSGLEAQILAWAIAGAQEQAKQRGRTFSLWCRCHEHETERRALLEGAGFKPLPARDLRLVRLLAIPLPAVHLPTGFVLRGGMYGEELELYQELHRAVFDGIGMGLDSHQSPAYKPDLDVIAVDVAGTFAAFCLCEFTEVADSSGEYAVGEIGVIGTRPTYQRRGLGRALLLSGMHRLKERGATSVFLETKQAETPALHLFTSLGFRRVSTWQWMTMEIAPLT